MDGCHIDSSPPITIQFNKFLLHQITAFHFSMYVADLNPKHLSFQGCSQKQFQKRTCLCCFVCVYVTPFSSQHVLTMASQKHNIRHFFIKHNFLSFVKFCFPSFNFSFSVPVPPPLYSVVTSFPGLERYFAPLKTTYYL